MKAARDLVKREEVEAIVGAQSLQEAKLLATISEKDKVPIISPFAPISLSLSKYDHLIQFTHDSTSEAKGITKLIHDFNWRSIVVIYEDLDDWRQSLQILLDHVQDKGINIDRIVSFAESSRGEEDYMVNQLRKLKSSRTSIFVVHMSEILVYSLFRCADKLGMMEQGYVWILTARTMNHFHYTDRFAVNSMQGVIGFRSYVSGSEQVKNFSIRLRKLMVDDDDETKHSSLELIGVWGHDIACVLANAVEKMRLRGESTNLLETAWNQGFVSW